VDDEAILALALAGLFIVAVGSLWWTRLGRALRERVRRPFVTPDAALIGDVLEEVQELRREVDELSARLDFNERLLAQQRNPQGLGPGSEP